MDYLVVLFWRLVGSVFSLIGGIALVSNKVLREKAIKYGLPFGAGALLAAAFLGVLPEAVEGIGIHATVWYVLGGFLGFFVLERLLSWFHHHESHHHEQAHGKRNETHQWLVIVGDTLHNAIDGVAIGAAFLVNPAAGIGTALALAAHEIPQEIGDFGILLGKGMKPRKVVLVNLLSALATVLTALVTFTLGDAMNLDPTPLLAVAAGFFIYIAASDIIPDIHEKSRREGNVQALILLFGVAVLAIVIQLTPHSHGHEESGEHGHSQHDEADIQDHKDEHSYEEESHHDHDEHGEHESEHTH